MSHLLYLVKWGRASTVRTCKRDNMRRYCLMRGHTEQDEKGDRWSLQLFKVGRQRRERGKQLEQRKHGKKESRVCRDRHDWREKWSDRQRRTKRCRREDIDWLKMHEVSGAQLLTARQSEGKTSSLWITVLDTVAVWFHLLPWMASHSSARLGQMNGIVGTTRK